MSIITVRGEINSEELGITLMHEHILLDLRQYFEEFQDINEKALSKQKVGIRNLGILRKNHRALKDNLVLSDIILAMKELLEFKKAGGRTIVDVTNIGMGQNPITLQNISNELDINIIAGCGYYVAKLHPAYIEEKKEDEIAQEMINSIRIGIGETNVRAGIIGEIGTSEEIFPSEKKVLKAISIAQKETGAALSIHIDPWSKNGLEVLDILKGCGADLTRVVICHVDADINMDYYKAIINKGVTIEFDSFGKEYIKGRTGMFFMRDRERIIVLKKLINMGFVSQLVISTDIHLKTDLIRYRGCGYAHILNNIVPLMLREGITKKDIDVIMIENPRRILNIENRD